MVDLADIDENAPIGIGLDDNKFIKSREAILLLLPKLFHKESARWSSLDIMEHFIDETVEEIAHIWSDK